MLTGIYISGERLDLFQDENISVTSSVLDIQDIAKNTTDYSNSFTVPASERNNRIFKHYYDADIDNSFDARTSIDARIEIGGMTFRVGKLLLQKVSVKSGRPSSYTVNFWGDLVSLKDILGDDKLSDLDLSALDFVYNSTNVLTALQDATAYAPLIVNLLAKKQYYYNSNAADVVMSDTLANIHYKAATANGINWNELRPSIAIFKIIEAITTDYGIVFSDDFFGTNEFKKLYLWLNNSITNNIGSDSGQVEFNGGDNNYVSFASWIGTFITNGIPGGPTANWFKLTFDLTPDAGFENVQYTMKCYAGTELLQQKTFIGATSMTLDLTSFKYDWDSHTWYITYYIESNSAFDYTCNLEQIHYLASTPTTYNTTGLGSLSSYFRISDNIPDITIIEFLKGLFQACKLVVIPEQDGTVYVNTVESFYSQGSIVDITNYVDIENVDVSRGDILNKISFKFQEPTTILNKQFLQNNGIAYGDEEAELRDNAGKLLDGETFEIQLPFEQIIYERLYDENGTDEIQLMYGAVVDENLKPVNPKPHIFYNQQYSVGGDGIGIITESSKVQITDAINTASHVISDSLPEHSFIFSQEFNNFNSQTIENTLYSNYHETYISNLFNIKRRNWVYQCPVLPVNILLKLSLNDILKIGYNYYRIDKFTTDLVTGKTELNLVNSFENNLTAFTTKDSYIIVNSPAIVYSAYVTNLTTFTSAKVDLGSGVAWLTVGQSGSFVTFTATENTGVYRDMQINVTDSVSATVISFYFGQRAQIIDASTDTITADSDLFTADNDKNYI